MSFALVIHDNEEMLQLLKGGVSAALEDAECIAARNIEEGRKTLGRRGYAGCQLIVASLTARLDPSHVPGLERRDLTALDFMRELRASGAETPALLVASFIDTERIAQASQVTRTQLLSAQDLFSKLGEEVRRAVRSELATPKYRVDLDIVLRAGQNQACSWRMKGSGGIAIEEADVMDISDSELADLKGFSQPADHGDSRFLRTLGLKIYKVLMADSLKSGNLELKLNNSVSSFGGLAIARIRFNVDQSTHGIHLETLAKPEVRNGDPEFWMLKTPMFRKFGDRGNRFPLFKDARSQRERIDCLLIQGQTSAFSVTEVHEKSYPELKGAQAETAWLADHLRDRGEEIGEVTVLRHDQVPHGELANAIRQALATNRYRLVHYTGHSELHAPSDKAYLVLGGEENDMLPIESFSEWASSSVQFVYLSSCQSASSQFIMKLVATEIPAVAGFAWPVADAVALNFARSFYEILFGDDRDRRFLEYSFMRAKQSLHRKYPARSHWVAPLLFMQVFDTQMAASA